VGDNDFDIADMIAEEVGSALPAGEKSPVELSDDPRADQLYALAAQIEGAANAFEVLGLDREAENGALRESYRDLAKQLHPDRFAGSNSEILDLANGVFDKVREAWDVLETDEKRQKYCDHVLDGVPTEEEEAMETVRIYMDAEAEFKRGLAAFNAGRISQAHKLFESSSAAVPDELEFEVYLSYTTYNMNQQTNPEKAASAMESLKDALEANQNQERRLDGGWVLLGRIYREQGNAEAAKRCLVQALRFNPSNSDATRELRRLDGRNPAGPKPKKKGFFGKLFGGKKK
jgi:tetratricopeptide (TPR) repeat protein